MLTGDHKGSDVMDCPQSKKRVLLVSVPGVRVAHPSEEENRFWRVYLALIQAEGVYGLRKEELARLGNAENQQVGLLHLGRLLKERGHMVAYLAPERDTIPLDEFVKTVLDTTRETPFDFVGLSFHTGGEPTARFLAQSVKGARPTTVVVAGGAHATGLTAIEDDSPIDLYVRGRGNLVLPHIVEHVSVLSSTKRIWEGPDVPAWFGAGLKTRVFPEPDNLLMNVRYLPGARVYTALGCGKMHPCGFCGSIVHHRSVVLGGMEQIFANIDDLVSNFGTRFIYFGDENFFMDSSHASRVVERLRKYKGVLHFSLQANVESIRAEPGLLCQLGQTGMCTEVQVGAESANQKILDMVGKGLRVQSIEEVGHMVHDNGMRYLGYWLSWLPGETMETHEQTTDKICGLIEDGAMNYAECTSVVPFPGTPLYEDRDRYGIEIVDTDFRLWRGENMPVFRMRGGPPREKMYELYLNRLSRIADLYGARYGNLVGRQSLDALSHDVGVDPFSTMSAF